MRLLIVATLIALGVGATTSGPAHARTARNLQARIQIDGFTVHAGPADTSEWRNDEKIFGVNLARGLPEESSADSKWTDNDISQIRVTWDKDSLYVAVDAVIWGNNVLVWLDVWPDDGIADMRSLNSWRRNFIFDGTMIPGCPDNECFGPDLFGATWDGNTSPHLLLHQSPTFSSQVNDQQTGEVFRSAATFSQNLRGRAMEFAIPWNTVFLGPEGRGTTPVYVASIGDTVQTFPPGTVLKLAGAITAGGDGTGGPDSAPDNTRGHVVDGNADVVIDNWAILPLDLQDDTGLGGGGPDGVADWGIAPKERVTFRFQPPITAVPIDVGELSVDRPAFAPDRGERTQFSFSLQHALDPANPIDVSRTVNLSANVYDLRGRFIRNLYINIQRNALDHGDPCQTTPQDPACQDVWDGRDENGRIVPAGVYILRVVLEPGVGRMTHPVVVVR